MDFIANDFAPLGFWAGYGPGFISIIHTTLRFFFRSDSVDVHFLTASFLRIISRVPILTFPVSNAATVNNSDP